MKQKLKRMLAESLTVLAIFCGGCYNGASVSPVVGFGARPIESELPGMSYDPATSIGVRGNVATTSGVEAELEVSLFNINSEAGVVNHKVDVREISANVLYPVLSNKKGEVYVGAGLTNTSQTVDETYDVIPGNATITQSDTDFRAFVGGRIGAGKGDVDVRATVGSRGTTLSAGYNFYF